MNEASMEKRINSAADLSSWAEKSDLLKDLLHTIQGVAAQINLLGWCEANAGNISVNVTRELSSVVTGNADWYLVSRTGSRYRQLAQDPIPSLVLVSVSGSFETFSPSQAAPTSEWSCHRKLQEHFKNRDLKERVILHSHPASIIQLSQMEIYKEEILLNQALAKALPEYSLYLPEGAACVSFAPPGSKELAEATYRAIKDRKILFWQGHGIISCGENPDQALDRMEVAEKAARILLHKFLLTKYRL